MLESPTELENLYDDLNINNINNSEELYDINQDPLNFSNISVISKSKFAQHYHFLCKYCERVPIIEFIKANKIKYICKCEDSPRNLDIKDTYNYLYYFDELDLGIEKLKCHLHSKEYGYYCEECKINLCLQCFSDCNTHQNKIISLLLKNYTIYKYYYIYKNIKDKNQNYIDMENNSLDNNKELENKLINLQNNLNDSFCDENHKLIEDSEIEIKIEKDDKINNDEKKEIINTLENNKNDEIYDNDYYYINLFTLILNDYQNFPNIKLVETISNIEIFLILSFNDYNKINLNYEFTDKNDKLDELEIFGENFVNNNKENCFLIINDKILELSRFINLYNIFDNIPSQWPIQLNVNLIERKYKLMTDLSYMFDGISTLSFKSKIGDFNSIHIKKMNHMFNNCRFLKKLPDISNLNTENVSDMNHMFDNCLLLTKLPDISKWNMEKVNDISYMFQNCQKLKYLPDISKWKLKEIERIRIEGAFINCKSLTSFPDISNWNIQGDNKKVLLFGGCQLLEEKITKKNFKFKSLFKCFKNISCAYNNIINNFIFFIVLGITIYFIYLFFYYQIASLYYSFQLNKINDIISNPMEYFNLLDHINTTYISERFNNIKKEEIEAINEDKEYFIKSLLNFSRYSNNRTFDSIEKKFKIINIMHLIIFFLKYIILILLILAIKFEYSSLYKIIFFILFLSHNFFSLILESTNIYDIRTLLDYLTYFLNSIEICFRIEIPESVYNETKKLNNSLNADYICIIISLFFIVTSVYRYYRIRRNEAVLMTYNDYLNNKIN